MDPLRTLRTAPEHGIAYSHLRGIRVPADEVRALLKQTRHRSTRDHLLTALYAVGCQVRGNEPCRILTDDRDRLLVELSQVAA